MTRIKRSGPPSTRNLEAADLISRATAVCEKCRTDWRLFPQDQARTVYLHRGRTICSAPTERKRLREIAAEAKQ